MLNVMQRVATINSKLQKSLEDTQSNTIVRMGDFVFHAMRYGHTEDAEMRGNMSATVLRWMLRTKQGVNNLHNRAPMFVKNLCLVLRRCLDEVTSFDATAIRTACDALHAISTHKTNSNLVRADLITILSQVSALIEMSYTEDCGLDNMLRLVAVLIPLSDATCCTLERI